MRIDGRAWLGAAAIIPAQMTTMLIRNGEMGILWPLAMVFASVLGLPFLGAAFVGRLSAK